MIRAVEKIVLVLFHLGKFGRKIRIDMHMARRAGATPAAQRKEFVEPIVPDHFHNGEAAIRVDCFFLAGAIDDYELGHGQFLMADSQYGAARLCDAGQTKSRVAQMGIDAAKLKYAMDRLVEIEPAFKVRLDEIGYPPPRIRDRGYQTLLRTILGQQVSVASADAVWRKLDGATGDATDPAKLLAADDETLRSAGLSRQKSGYARGLAERVVSGALDLSALPEEDEEAIAQLVAVKGIGRWSAEIYLLFAEGRPDIWPAGDLAVQIEIGKLRGWPERPSEDDVRDAAEPWRPYRGAAAIFAWHSYSIEVI